MSKPYILRQIERLENIADAYYGASIEEIYSLTGQMEGTVQNIKDAFWDFGIDPEIRELSKLGRKEFNPGNVQELVRVLQHAAARYRGMVDRI